MHPYAAVDTHLYARTHSHTYTRIIELKMRMWHEVYMSHLYLPKIYINSNICEGKQFLNLCLNPIWFVCDTLSHINHVVNAPPPKNVFYLCTLLCCSCSLYVCVPNDDPIVYFISLIWARRVMAQEQKFQRHKGEQDTNMSSDLNNIGTRIILHYSFKWTVFFAQAVWI